MVSHWGISGGRFTELAGPTAADAVFVQTYSFFGRQGPAGQRVLAALKQKYGVKGPEDVFSPVGLANAYDAMHLLAIAMQKAGSVVCHMIHRQKLKVPVLFVDTGVMFQETLDTRDRMLQEYRLDIRTLSPRLTMAEQTAQLGVLYLNVEGQKQCCHMRKVEPLLEEKG